MKRFTRIRLASVMIVGGLALPATSHAAEDGGLKIRSLEEAVPKVMVPRPSRPEEEPGWVTRRVRELQPTEAERRIDRVGWATSLLEAEKLAKQHNRPVFLFTHDGRMGNGRC
jgi:hypothetical protein